MVLFIMTSVILLYFDNFVRITTWTQTFDKNVIVLHLSFFDKNSFFTEQFCFDNKTLIISFDWLFTVIFASSKQTGFLRFF